MISDPRKIYPSLQETGHVERYLRSHGNVTLPKLGGTGGPHDLAEVRNNTTQK